MKAKIILVILTVSCILNAGIFVNQDDRNKEFMLELDKNILSSIMFLTTFNDGVKNMPEDVTGAETYKHFLMEMTIECSKFRESIRNSENMKKGERELQIKLMITSLKPDVVFDTGKVSKQKNEANIQRLDESEKMLKKMSEKAMKAMLGMEQEIVETRKIKQEYIAVHSQHFLYSLLLDFIDINDLMSKKNRNHLASVVKDMEMSFVQQKKIEKK
jgi:hypothetical protein